jgi:hypothetical protein
MNQGNKLAKAVITRTHIVNLGVNQLVLFLGVKYQAVLIDEI